MHNRQRENQSGSRLTDLTPCYRGFTLVELLVVMAIIATLLSIVAPQYLNSLDRLRETVLRQNLNVMRDSIENRTATPGNIQGIWRSWWRNGIYALFQLILLPIAGKHGLQFPRPTGRAVSTTSTAVLLTRRRMERIMARGSQS